MVKGAYVVYPSSLLVWRSRKSERARASTEGRESEGREDGGGGEDTAYFSSALSWQLSAKFLTLYTVQ